MCDVAQAICVLCLVCRCLVEGSREQEGAGLVPSGACVPSKQTSALDHTPVDSLARHSGREVALGSAELA